MHANLHKIASEQQAIRGECALCGKSHKFKYMWAENDVGRYALSFLADRLGHKCRFDYAHLCGVCCCTLRNKLWSGRYSPFTPQLIRKPETETEKQEIEFLILQWIGERMLKLNKKAAAIAMASGGEGV